MIYDMQVPSSKSIRKMDVERIQNFRKKLSDLTEKCKILGILKKNLKKTFCMILLEQLLNTIYPNYVHNNNEICQEYHNFSTFDDLLYGILVKKKVIAD